MYYNLKTEMEKANYNITNLAAQIGVTGRALHNKIYGKTKFKWSEATKIRIIIAPQITLEELFKRD